MDETTDKKIPFISIIMPVYNVEKYLVRSLDSIFNQVFKGAFEVIAVDDCSTDNSLKVLKSYREKERRLIIIEHAENMKVSIARSSGMNAAIGDYIMHVDPDDWMAPGALECLQQKIKQTSADVIVFNYIRENTEGKRGFVKKIKKEKISINKTRLQVHFYGAPWNKIVKRSIIKGMIFGQKGINNGDDLLYATEILIRVQKIKLIREFLYVYFLNTSSLTQTATNEDTLKTLANVTHEFSNLLNNYKETEIAQNLYKLRLQYSIDFISKNMFNIKREKYDLIPLITELKLFPNSEKTKINLMDLSNSPFYFLLQIGLGRIRLKNIYHFLRSLYLTKKQILTIHPLMSNDKNQLSN
ncbi:MAG: glycosyltransferase family 2 protein [Bacteroidetes bacterium]|nr:glycosyltransferase family 2 protein [Bacteroidota bacterium]